jgi:chlorophyllide a reductase subunit Z
MPWDTDALALLDAEVESEPFLVRISAAKTLRDRVELEARKANEGRVTAARVMLALGRRVKAEVS